MWTYNQTDYNNDYLAHHGIKGQKWGVRRYQNPDGSLTPAGQKRYGIDGERTAESIRKELNDTFEMIGKNQSKVNSLERKNAIKDAIWRNKIGKSLKKGDEVTAEKYANKIIDKQKEKDPYIEAYNEGYKKIPGLMKELASKNVTADINMTEYYHKGTWFSNALLSRQGAIGIKIGKTYDVNSKKGQKILNSKYMHLGKDDKLVDFKPRN